MPEVAAGGDRGTFLSSKVGRVALAAVVSVNIVLIVSLLFGGNSLTGIAAYRELTEEYRALQMEYQECERSQILLSRQILMLKTDGKYMEKMIRQKLNYMRAGEIQYLFEDGKNSSGEKTK